MPASGGDGSLRLFALTCGWLSAPRGAFVVGATGQITVPVPAYLVLHPNGSLLFDSGLHVATQTDPEARLGRIARVYQVRFEAGEEIASRLEAIDVDPTRVDFLVSSHLHFDHSGGNESIPNARWLVQRREWEAACDPELARANGFRRQDWDHGHERGCLDGEHDVFGDGSVVCVPTYGHTPGHQSLRVALPDGPVLLAGDACYLRENLERLALPPVLHDPEATLAALRRLRAWRDAGTRIFYGHDPEFWRGVPQAPEAIR